MIESTDPVREGNRLHWGRHWGGPGWIEQECPCPKQECGLVQFGGESEQCDQHKADRSVRVGHRSKDCPGASG